MGSYDFLIEKGKIVQIKLFSCEFKEYKVGDKVPLTYGKDYTIILPRYEPSKYALIKNGKFIKLTNSKKEVYPPYISKWGDKLEKIEDLVNPFSKGIEQSKKRRKINE